TPSIQSHQSRTPTETKTVEKTQKAKPKKVKKVAKAAKKEKKATDAPPSFLPSIGAKKVERREITLDDLVDQSLKSLRFCNDSVMSKRPNYEGIMKLSFSVLPSGQVSGFKIRAIKGELLSTYKSCAERRVKKWSFPKQSAKKYVQREVEIF
ncbi:MAG: AgmX/PglI C-terminal domain-containing protein, partial [Myxococcota bacterium]|nr:AgmX/PglI C-terminal domain-containing protein [Myxococcota bacterium]